MFLIDDRSIIESVFKGAIRKKRPPFISLAISDLAKPAMQLAVWTGRSENQGSVGINTTSTGVLDRDGWVSWLAC